MTCPLHSGNSMSMNEVRVPVLFILGKPSLS